MKKKTLLERIIERLPFKTKILELVLSRNDLQLSEVQLLLARLGYLAEGYQPGQLDDLTRKALSLFQKFYNLDLTGTITLETMQALKDPRCGNADLDGDSLDALEPSAPMDFVPDLRRGCSYHNVTTLRYTILNTPRNGGLKPDEVEEIIAKAFSTWAEKIPIKFELAQGINNANFKLKWAKDEHGDGNKNIFDNSRSLYAHAFYPPDCNEPFPGECHFNDHHIWGRNDDPAKLVFNLETVALHEIGHLLGLKHSKNPNSIMFARYPGNPRKLEGDALVSIQKLYGSA